MPKIIELHEIKNYIKDNAVIFTSGFGLAGFAEEITIAIEKSFLESGHPRGLTAYYSAGQGNFKDRGLHYLAHEGLLKRLVGPHFGACGPVMTKLITENKIEAYNLPQGVLALMTRNIAGRRPGFITKVGLGTFVDPRLEGGKVNEITKEDLIEVIKLEDQEWLYYKNPKIDVAIIRGSVADELGNLTLEREGILVEALSIAQAARAGGGIVIAQVEHIVKAGTLRPKDVIVPGINVDYLAVARPEHHFQTMGVYFNPAYNGEIRIPMDSVKPMELDERKVICRRAAMELTPSAVVNLGIGMPDGVAAVAAEERVDHFIYLTTESGGIGGVPAQGLDFGHTVNAEAIIEHSYQFDFYDGGGIDITFLGLAQTDRFGNVNVSKFSSRPVGCGGFINITQNAKKIVYCGTFTAGGLEVKVAEGKLKILREGKNKKFITDVEQITFSGKYAISIGQSVIYVTERAVFELTSAGLELVEIAPGIDLERDILSLMDFQPIIRSLKTMPSQIFCENWGKLAEHMTILQKSAG